MSMFMTILSFAVIGQISSDQTQAEAAVEPARQTTPAEDNQSNRQYIFPGCQRGKFHDRAGSRNRKYQMLRIHQHRQARPANRTSSRAASRLLHGFARRI